MPLDTSRIAAAWGDLKMLGDEYVQLASRANVAFVKRDGSTQAPDAGTRADIGTELADLGGDFDAALAVFDAVRK